MTRHVRCFLVLVALIATVVAPMSGAPFRSVGLRILIPFGGLPVTLGLEATADIGFLIGALSFYISLDGDVLLLGSLDMPLNPDALGTCGRLTLAAYDFDPRPALPSLAIGGGVSYHNESAGWLGISVVGEFIYPIAFPLPMFSVAGGWMVP